MKKIEGLDKAEMKMIIDVLEHTEKATVKDIRIIDKICKVFEQAEGGAVELEDTDHVYMSQKLQGFNGWLANEKARGIILSLAEKLGL